MTCLALIALALVAAGGAPGEGASVAVRVLETHHPASAVLSRAGERHAVAARGDALLVDDSLAGAPLRLSEDRWQVAVPGVSPRAYEGSLSVAARRGEIVLFVRMPIEAYVAGVVASESVADTPAEALKALAVVVRSYALAARGRHQDCDLCDLAHCQVLRGEALRRHEAASRAATRATAGQVLRLGSGRIAPAPFHAACGGHTGDPAEIFGGEQTGAAAVPDPGCPGMEWTAAIPASTWAAVARGLRPSGASVEPPGGSVEPILTRGAGGFVVQVAHGGERASGDLFARALGGAMGHGVVRSARFEAHRSGDVIRLSGSGIGHGVGLCQAGAAARASRGESYRAILRHYFPLAVVAPL